MKKVLYAAVFAACAAPAFAGDVGLTISVGQPGFYGQLDIGNVPRPPQLVYPQAVVVRQAPEFVAAPPIYLHVPPGHEKHWSKHCHEYNACGAPVYFVRHDWYRDHVMVASGSDHGHGNGHGKGGHGKGHDD